jgi:hypothetical protein
MKNNNHFRLVRDMLTAARALLTDDDRAAILAPLKNGTRDLSVFVAVTVLCERFCDEIKSSEANLRDAYVKAFDPKLFARVQMLKEAVRAVTLTNVGFVLELIVTEKTGLWMLNHSDGRIKAGVPHWTGADLVAGKALLAPLGIDLFKRGDAYFETVKRGFKFVTEEVPVVRLLPFGSWEPDEQTKSLEAARVELDYAERGLEEVQRRCEAEPGDRISQQLADERQACAGRVFDARLKLRLVQLGKPDLAWQYECGEIPISSYDDRSPVQIAADLVKHRLETLTPIPATRAQAEAAYRSSGVPA